MEHLCDTLCYQLDLASFAACVNSGKSWTPKASFLMHGNASSEHDDAEVDPFVENLVLERLSAQSPLRVGLSYTILSIETMFGCSNNRL